MPRNVMAKIMEVCFIVLLMFLMYTNPF